MADSYGSRFDDRNDEGRRNVRRESDYGMSDYGRGYDADYDSYADYGSSADSSMGASSAAGGYRREPQDNLSRYDRSSYVGGSSRGSDDAPADDGRMARRYSRNRMESPSRARGDIPPGERTTRRQRVQVNGSSDGENADDVRRSSRPARSSRRAGHDVSTQENFSRSNAIYASEKPRSRRPLAIVGIVIAVIVLVGAGAAFAYFGSVSNRLHEGVDEDLRESLVQTDMTKEPFYMLLLGTDKSADREENADLDGVYRTDSMMLARIDPVNAKVVLISIPRDTLVDLGENGYQKVNAAYAFGGPSLAVDAVSDLAGVDISHYAEIDFDGFEAIVDSLGGIEVDVPMDIDDWEAGGSLHAGVQTLDGWEALILCRARAAYADVSGAPDLMRAANQRLVLSAIAHKMLDADVATIANTVSAAADYVTTDLELNDIVGIAQTMRGLDTENDIYTASFPTDSVYIFQGHTYEDMNSSQPLSTVDSRIEEGYYLLPDDTEWASMKKRMDAGEPPTEGSIVDEATGTVLATAGADAQDIGEKLSSVTVKNATDVQGAAMSTATALNKVGFKNVTVGEVIPGYEYPQTLVLYDDASKKREADLIVKTMGQGMAMQNDGTYLLESDFVVIIGDDWHVADDSDEGA